MGGLLPRSLSPSAGARNVSSRRSDLMSAAGVGSARDAEVPYPFPVLTVGSRGMSNGSKSSRLGPRCRGTVPLSRPYGRESWDVQRFKELPPRPGFVISPTLGSAANLYLLSQDNVRTSV